MSRLLRYTIAGEDRFLSISLEFTPQRVGPQEIHLPIWRPGQYQAQYFAKNIAGITSSRGLIRKSGLSTWTLTIDTLDPVVLSYRYFADQPDAGGLCFAVGLTLHQFYCLFNLSRSGGK